MADFVAQGRAGIRGLLILAGILLWLLLESSPQPLKVARSLVDGLLLISDREVDPLEGIEKRHYKKPLEQYRYQFKPWGSDFSINDEKLKELEEIPVQAVLELGRIALIEQPDPRPLTEIYASRRRNQLGQLETWFKASNLSEFSSLGELQQKLDSRLKIPIIEQSVNARSMLTTLAVAILCLNGFLTSLCATAARLASQQNVAELRAWMPLHLHSFGVTMSVLSILLPTSLWFLEAVLRPLALQEGDFSLASLVAGLFLGIFSLLTIRELIKLRARVRELSQKSAVSSKEIGLKVAA